MKRVLTVASHKGGVGKTTTALNLAYSLGRVVGQVLLVDLDPQSGLTHATNLRRRTRRGLIDLLRGEVRAEDVRATSKDGALTIVGVGEVLGQDVTRLERSAQDGTLRAAVDQLSQGFRYVVFDAPAGVGAIVRGILEISDGTLLVVNSRAITVRSIPAFLALIKDVASSTNPGLRLEGVLISAYDERSPSEAAVLAELCATLPSDLLFRTVIPHHELFEAASLRSLPIALQPGGEELARRYLDLALELREREIAHLQGRTDDEDPSLF
jgi:chromosome partitioning protein